MPQSRASVHDEAFVHAWTEWLQQLTPDSSPTPPAWLSRGLPAIAPAEEVAQEAELTRQGHPALGWAVERAQQAWARPDAPRALDWIKPLSRAPGPCSAPVRWVAGILQAVPLERLESPNVLPSVLDAWGADLDLVAAGQKTLGRFPEMVEPLVDTVGAALTLRPSPVLTAATVRWLRAGRKVVSLVRAREMRSPTPAAQQSAARWLREWERVIELPLLRTAEPAVWGALWPAAVAGLPRDSVAWGRVAAGTAENPQLPYSQLPVDTPNLTGLDFLLDWIDAQPEQVLPLILLRLTSAELLSLARPSPVRWTRVVRIALAGKLVPSGTDQLLGLLRDAAPPTGGWPTDVLRLLLTHPEHEIRLFGARVLGGMRGATALGAPQVPSGADPQSHRLV